MAKTEGRLIANNKKAYHDYFILEKYEAGIGLHGTEVKSLRMGQCSSKEAFIRIENGEIFIYVMHISPVSYTHLAACGTGSAQVQYECFLPGLREKNDLSDGYLQSREDGQNSTGTLYSSPGGRIHKK